MRLHVKHTTRYTYDAPVSYGLQQIRLTPTTSPHQSVLNWTTEIEGGEAEATFNDQYENHTILAQTHSGATQVNVTVSGEVETHTSDGVFGQIYGVAPLWHFLQSTERTFAGDGIRTLSKTVSRGPALLDGLHDLSKSILSEMPYAAVPTFADTSAEDAHRAGGGVCQDHAQVFISVARNLGIPARYVSGYLMMNDRVEQDASHAWAEAHIEGLGWVGFDVSNGYSPDERYVRVATGLDSHDAAPISGMRLGASQESMIVSVQIQQ